MANTEVPASSIEPGDHFWVGGKLHLADVVFTSEHGTTIACGGSDLIFPPGATVLRHTWKK